MKSLIKDLLPPLILRKAANLFYGWSGNYSSWEDASKKCSGYDSKIIIEKVKASLLKVKNGEAVYERDSVLFDEIHYSFPLLSALQYVALRNNEKLHVLDFGGSLGSSYFQNRKILSGLKEFSWSVVEQNHFVSEGKNTFADDNLNFYYTVEECLQNKKVNVLLLSSVIQYIEKPYELLEFIKSKNFEYIIFDRTPLLLKGNDRITIQTVPKNIYEAKYPCWLLNENNLKNTFLKDYDLMFDTELAEAININNAAYKSFFLKRKA